jgi:hypothetical protein
MPSGEQTSKKISLEIEESVKGWDQLSGMLIGVVLTLLTIYWTMGSELSKIASSFFVISFLLFANATTVNRKIMYENTRGKLTELDLRKWVGVAELSFGIAYTSLICGFTIMAYQILGDASVALLLNLVAWGVVAWYNRTSYIIFQKEQSISLIGQLRSLFRKRSLVWIILEAVILLLVFADDAGMWDLA